MKLLAAVCSLKMKCRIKKKGLWAKHSKMGMHDALKHHCLTEHYAQSCTTRTHWAGKVQGVNLSPSPSKLSKINYVPKLPIYKQPHYFTNKSECIFNLKGCALNDKYYDQTTATAWPKNFEIFHFHTKRIFCGLLRIYEL